MTNPSVSDFRDYKSHSIKGQPTTLLDQIVGLAAGQVSKIDTSTNARKENFVFFSVFYYKGAFTQMQEEIYIGIASHFIKIK